MHQDKAAAVYARTLLETAMARESGDAVSADMRALSESFRKLPALHKFLINPVRRSEEKAKLMGAAAGSVSALTGRFLKLLEIKNRFALLRGIAEEYLALEERKRNIRRAVVVSAKPLNQEQIDRLARGLEAGRPGQTYLLSNQIDASLIAGFRIVQGDSVTDASIKHKLDLLRQKLAA